MYILNYEKYVCLFVLNTFRDHAVFILQKCTFVLFYVFLLIVFNTNE